MKKILETGMTALVSSLLTFLVFQLFYAPYLADVITGNVVQSTQVSVPSVTETARVQLVLQDRYESVAGDFVAAARRVVDEVVHISVLDAAGKPSASGSGVIYSADGYIITNAHVVAHSNSLKVTLPDNRVFSGKVVGADPTTDIALVKIEADDLPHVRFADSDQIEVGQWVLAVGNPFNLASTVTAGIVSAKGRSINIIQETYSIESFIQTDAVVNPGNSGGALVNTEGALIGINTAIMSESGAYEGYSFAVPSNLVSKVVQDLQEYGSVQRAILGVSIVEVTSERARRLSLPEVEGVLISQVRLGSSAEKAGLKEGDVIVAVNDLRTRSVPQLQEVVGRYRPGDRIRVTYYRNGRQYVNQNIVLQGLAPRAYSSNR